MSAKGGVMDIITFIKHSSYIVRMVDRKKMAILALTVTYTYALYTSFFHWSFSSFRFAMRGE